MVIVQDKEIKNYYLDLEAVTSEAVNGTWNVCDERKKYILCILRQKESN